MMADGANSSELTPPLRSDLLSAVVGLRHGFFSRRGGVSDGLYNSLNCGFGSSDNPANVTINRARALIALGAQPGNLVTTYQVHSPIAVCVKRPWNEDKAPEADAMVTDQPGVTLGILTADCAPILLVDETNGVIGAAHSGWRGALTGILEATIEAMTNLGAQPTRIAAAIGPCIGFDSYEVGREFPDPFLAENQADAVYFRDAPRSDHFLFDLAGYVARRMHSAGITSIDHLNCDTFAEEASFFSYRRALHRDEEDYGRLISAISLAD
jgi:polyphenol oxidase